jgi:hypothetical protein
MILVLIRPRASQPQNTQLLAYLAASKSSSRFLWHPPIRYIPDLPGAKSMDLTIDYFLAGVSNLDSHRDNMVAIVFGRRITRIFFN